MTKAPDTNSGPYYFYPASRRQHAYCMAIDFGMRFKMRNGFWTSEGLLSITGAGGYRIEVAEESLHLLMPQVGDMVSNIGVTGWLVIRVRGDLLQIAGDRAARRCEVKIIQRGGLPFIWPEFEP